MRRYVLSYDLKKTTPDPHSEFLRKAAKVGWKPWAWIESSKKWYRLPNTTLVGHFETRALAEAAFDKAIAAATEAGKTVIVEKYFFAVYTEALLNSNDKRDASER